MIQIPYTLRTLAGEEETRMGERLFRAGRVRIAEKSAKLLRCQVVEDARWEVTISADAVSHKCGCTICFAHTTHDTNLLSINYDVLNLSTICLEFTSDFNCVLVYIDVCHN